MEQAIGVLKEQRNVEVRAPRSVLSEGGLCVLGLTLRRNVQLGKTPPLSLAFLIPALIP